jgi:hypothetical protein
MDFVQARIRKPGPVLSVSDLPLAAVEEDLGSATRPLYHLS